MKSRKPKKILFVINTMGLAGAEISLVELLKKLEDNDLEVSLYVLMGQGELIGRVPPYVRLLNADSSTESVLSKAGRKRLVFTVLRFFAHNDRKLQKLVYSARWFLSGMGKKDFMISRMLWRIVSDGAQRFEERFDLAVAWLEGGSAYYVADHVNAAKKAAFIHIDSQEGGYTKEMDQDCWKRFDRIFTVSEGIKQHFQGLYPEYAKKVGIFQNVIDQEAIRMRAKEPGGFSDHFEGIRLLTVGRLDYQKGYDIAVEAMKILKTSGYPVRWYALGEGAERKKLQKKIAALQLTEDFLLMGAVENPYPYYVQTDIYIHATRFEGKSIAIQEAQTLGCAVIASDCGGNRELITNGRDGILCKLTPHTIAQTIVQLLNDSEKRKELGLAAKEKQMSQGEELKLQLKVLAGNMNGE